MFKMSGKGQLTLKFTKRKYDYFELIFSDIRTIVYNLFNIK